MASKYYAYYLKGNKVAVVQKDTTDTSAIDYGRYKSPTEAVADGLEVEYSYSPWYNFNSSGSIVNDNVFRFLGYGSDGENLVLITYGESGVVDLSSKFSPGDYVYVNKGPFVGIHQLSDKAISEEGGAYGVLATKTRFNPQDAILNKLRDSADSGVANQIGFTNQEVISFGSNLTATINDYRSSFLNNSSADNYIYIHNHPGDGSADISDANVGFFSLDNSYKTDDTLKVVNKYTLNDGTLVETAASMVNDSNNNGWVMYRAFKRQFTLYKLDAMQDESFELDLTRYQCNAVVYYVKAKMAEDLRDIDGKEYYMREFKKCVEKERSGRKSGPYIMQGSSVMKNY